MLQGVKFQITNLDGLGDLGLTTPGLVQIDDNGDGYGWFVDPTPKTDVEFATKVAATELKAISGSPAFGRMDLLTVVMHELGHFLGLTDLSVSASPHGLMAETITTGIRCLPPAMTLALVTPMKATAGLPLMLAGATQLAPASVASDAVFATLTFTAGSELPPHATAPTTPQTSAVPMRVEANLAALQPAFVLNPSSSPIASGAPRKGTASVEAVFSLLER